MAGIGCAAVRRIILFALLWFDSTISAEQKVHTMQKSPAFTFYCVLTLFASVTCLQLSHAQKVCLAVSDLIADFVRPEVMALAERTDVEVSYESIGSLPAIERLRAGSVDFAIMAFPEGSDVPRDEFSVFPFAYDATIIAVNKNNPLDEISLGRLAGVFGESEESNFTTWGDLGLSGWGSRKLKLLSGHEVDSIALELFKFSVLFEGALKSSVDNVQPTEAIDLLAKDPAAVAILSRVPTESDAKILLLSSDDSSPAYGPTNDNIHFGDYPIRLPFYIVFSKYSEQAYGPFLRVLWGDELANDLVAGGIFALPDTVRRKLLVDLDLDDIQEKKSEE
jgi:ABC-type phosphate transport system substrate-binding protein